jgi:hypothetical protein
MPRAPIDRGDESGRHARIGVVRTYEVYGLRVGSTFPLPCPESGGGGAHDVEIITQPDASFTDLRRRLRARAPSTSFCYATLDDGSQYLRWPELFEFCITPDGRRIAGQRLGRGGLRAFQTYLLGQVPSFALVKQGIEPLHATAVVIDGEAVGFVGDGGAGKSSLAAAFLGAGVPLLTDDLLIITGEGGALTAHPGPPRIKLFPEVATRVLGTRSGTRMNSLTPKLIVPLAADGRCWRRPAPLRALYVLGSRRSGPDGVVIRRLSPPRAVVTLVGKMFNTIVSDPGRLRAQLDLVGRVVNAIPVKRLAFPRRLAFLPVVRAAIERDLAA